MPSVRTTEDQDVYPVAPHIIILAGKYFDIEHTLATCVPHDVSKHGCDYQDAVNRIKIRLKNDVTPFLGPGSTINHR